MNAWTAGRADQVEGRPLSPRAFRHFGIEAVVLGPAQTQEGLVRREGVAIWRRLEAHAPVFDRVAEQAGTSGENLLAVRVVVATTPSRDRAMRVPALGERAARARAAAGGPPPATRWLLLVDEGPGETWLYLADEREPATVLAGFLGRRGRTDFARARRRSKVGRLASLGIFAGLLLVVYGPAARLGVVSQALGAALVSASVAALVLARPR
ncbi:MAG TPA: hypothetical protein VFA46_11195 [Actinomycetes bacterium]|jgi:hypothetical protein|nr:hypothetical protein [Actinomycetes bacterium]